MPSPSPYAVSHCHFSVEVGPKATDAAFVPARGSCATIRIDSLTLINPGRAEQKRRPIWFLISLVLGPIGNLLIVVLEPADQRP